MKKAANSTPDRLLKVERELRGWSQKYVADRIGADHYYLSPWEHGTASPSPIGVKLRKVELINQVTKRDSCEKITMEIRLLQLLTGVKP